MRPRVLRAFNWIWGAKNPEVMPRNPEVIPQNPEVIGPNPRVIGSEIRRNLRLMPVLARFGQFWQFWQFIGNSPGSTPEGSRGLVESWSKGRLVALALRLLSPGGSRGITAGDPGGEFAARRDVGCGVPDGLVVDPRPVIHQKRGRKLASPGGRLCLRHQEIARNDSAGTVSMLTVRI